MSLLEKNKMDIITYLGDFLASLVNISPPAARGLLKLAIKDEIGPFKPFIQINYNELKATIRNALKSRMDKLGFQNTEGLISLMLNELRDNQSFITMAKV
jgi:hypothetical protein